MTIDMLLWSFTDKSGYRPTLENPFVQGEYIYATEAHVILKVPINMVTEKYSQTDKDPDISRLKYKEYPKKRIIKSSLIKEILEGIEKVNSKYECDICDGFGSHECSDCGHDHECGGCNGTGEIEDKYTKIYPKESVYIKISEAWISAYYLNELMRVVTFAGVKQITLNAGGGMNPNWFTIGDMEFAVMGVCPENDDNWADAIKHTLLK